jgi:L-seryl-tRNA(Ser) seleniumtransferase
MKRAIRCDKFTIAALASTLQLYQNEEKALREIPTLRLLTRSRREIQSLADRIFPDIANKLKGTAEVEIINCYSQVGSGALPDKLLPSVGISIRKGIGKKGGKFPNRLASAFRKLPIPVIGRIHRGALVLDLRCLEDEALFLKQIHSLNLRADL